MLCSVIWPRRPDPAQEYRHPSCLVKHRWEHSPHWKETAQLSMSKHQQVQMLEVSDATHIRRLCLLTALVGCRHSCTPGSGTGSSAAYGQVALAFRPVPAVRGVLHAPTLA